MVGAEKTKGYRSVGMALSLAFGGLLTGCVSNPQQQALTNAALQTAMGQGGNPQLAAGLAQGAARTALAVPAVELPAKLSCKDLSKRLIQARSDMASVGVGQNKLPVATDSKLAMAATAASVIGAVSGNAQLADAGGQLSSLTANGKNDQLAALDALRGELETRAANQKCKLPIEARVSPTMLKMSCNQIASEWLATHQQQALAATAPAAQPLSGLGGAGNKLQATAAIVGAVASVAASATGNQELGSIANVANQVGGGGAAAPAAVSPVLQSALARDELEMAASAKRCKLPATPQVVMVVPAAANIGAMSCGHLKQELKALSAMPAAVPQANQMAAQAQTVGMLASVAGALTGNQALKSVGDQANALAGGGVPGNDLAIRRTQLEAQAKAQRCKL